MNLGHLLKYLRNRIIGAGVNGLEKGVVSTGNEAFRHNGRGIWVRISPVSDAERGGSERRERREIGVTVLVCVPPGTGIERAYDAAERIAGLFVPFDSVTGAFKAGKTCYYVLESYVKGTDGDGEGGRVPVLFRFAAAEERDISEEGEIQ